MGHSALPSDERVNLSRQSEPSTIIKFALKVDERIRRYGREYPVPPHVGDLLALDHFTHVVTVTAVHDDGSVSLRPYEPAAE